MAGSPTELDFTESEFEQAGLLHHVHNTIGSERVVPEVVADRQLSIDSNTPAVASAVLQDVSVGRPLSASTESELLHMDYSQFAAHAPSPPEATADVCSRILRRHANREHQRRFRQKQKVPYLHNTQKAPALPKIVTLRLNTPMYTRFRCVRAC